MKRTILAFSVLVGSLQAFGQLSFVADINPGIQSSAPTRVTAFNDKLVFFADDGINGNELWVLDSSGAQMVYDINPGSGNSGLVANFTKMAVAAGRIYFPADDGVTGQELYSWNGDMSMPPTVVMDINTSGTSGTTTVNEVISLNDKVYFTAFSPTGGYELWMHDPATLNTTQITNINSGSASSSPENLAIYKEAVYFSATNSANGRELYKYDPVTNNTTMVFDINTGSGNSNPQSLVVVGEKLYFSATTSAYGRELYSFDSLIVTRLSDVNPGSADGILSAAPGQKRIGSLNDTLYFCGNDGTTGDQLFQHNKQNGTQVITYNINPGSTSFPSSFITYGKHMYFSAYDDTNGIELWRYDGTNAPEMVADIDSVGSSNPLNMEIMNNVLYFSANSLDSGIELYMLIDSSAFVGIKNVKFEGTARLYPNPASEYCTIELRLKNSEKLSISLVDMTGRQVSDIGLKSYPASTSAITIPLGGLQSGMYFYNVNSESGIRYMSGKLLKQ